VQTNAAVAPAASISRPTRQKLRFRRARNIPTIGSMSEGSPTILQGTRSLRHGRYSVRNQIYHITTATAWRRKLFTSFAAARELVDTLRHETETGSCETLCFMIMPDHLHWLMRVRDGGSLAVCVNNVKANSARRINALRGKSERIWQKGFYDRALRSDEDAAAVARYIVANPLRAGIVEHVGEYPFWDAIWV
jgi:REP element-mobilizing transposase RayT